MPAAGSNCVYAGNVLFNTFMLLLYEDGRCLDDVRHLKGEPALMNLFGFKTVPNAHTLGNCLHRVGDIRCCDQALDAVNQQLLKAALPDGYQAQLINYARGQQMGFAVRARMDSQVKQSISAIKEKD